MDLGDGAKLRPATRADLPRLRELLALPDVYEYLNDDEPPSAALIEDWAAEAIDGPAPFGLWLLVDAGGALIGCVRLAPVEDDPAAADLAYTLHPAHWGRGLAIAMGRAAIAKAFEAPACEAVVAGADVPNSRSIAVMKRLGMCFHRDVTYPAGPGVQYRLTRTARPGPR